jgi:hypothetical protein
MLSDYIESFEPYLQQLLQHRKSSQLKLIAAWDGLSIETQIKILHKADRIPDEIIKKSLNSNNDYVRYLIVNKFGIYHFEKGNFEEKELFEKISNDSGIAKYAHKASQQISIPEKNEHGNIVYVLKPENFFAMPHEEQILHFSELSVRDGEDIAKIIEWGFSHKIDHEHISNLIEELEHIFNKYKTDKYMSDDGHYEYSHAKGLEALWKLVPKLGSSKPAKYLVWSLPTSGILFSEKIIEDVISSLPKKLIIYLLERRDFYYFDLRKKIASSPEAIFDSEIKAAAASKLKDPRILSVAKQEKSETKTLLIQWGIFIFGFVCLFLDAPRWIAYICIGLPCISWIKNDIKQTINNKIDETVNRIDRKIKNRLKKHKK